MASYTFPAATQVRETARRHFSGLSNLILLVVNVADHDERLRWEPSRGGDLFPHFYGELRLDHIDESFDLYLDPSGEHRFPSFVP
ncbi:MAG: DUF952 domain-containing protein [Pirellulaceae bacterium]